MKIHGRRWMPSPPHSSDSCTALTEPRAGPCQQRSPHTAPAWPSPESFPTYRGGVSAVPAGSRRCRRGRGAAAASMVAWGTRTMRAMRAVRHHAARGGAPPPSMVRPGSRGPGRPSRRYHCRAGGASASARPAVTALRSASRACASPLPALQASSPALSSEDATLTSPAPRAPDERARFLSAAGYKALGRTTPSGGGLCHCSTGGGRRGSHFLLCGPWGPGAGGAAGIAQTPAQNPKKTP